MAPRATRETRVARTSGAEPHARGRTIVGISCLGRKLPGSPWEPAGCGPLGPRCAERSATRAPAPPYSLSQGSNMISPVYRLRMAELLLRTILPPDNPFRNAPKRDASAEPKCKPQGRGGIKRWRQQSRCLSKHPLLRQARCSSGYRSAKNSTVRGSECMKLFIKCSPNEHAIVQIKLVRSVGCKF